MPIVDTHCHVSLVYYEPVEVLLFQMDRARRGPCRAGPDARGVRQRVPVRV